MSDMIEEYQGSLILLVEMMEESSQCLHYSHSCSLRIDAMLQGLQVQLDKAQSKPAFPAAFEELQACLQHFATHTDVNTKWRDGQAQQSHLNIQR